MKLYHVLALPRFYEPIVNNRLPFKTIYKLTRLAQRVEQEKTFYQEQIQKLIEEYGQKEDGNLIYTEDGSSVKIIEGKEEECNTKIFELNDLDIDLSEFSFSVEEFDGLELTMEQMDIIMPLIKI